MPILGYRLIILPLLDLIRNRDEYYTAEIQARLSYLREEEKNTLDKTTRDVNFRERIVQSITYLRSAGLLSTNKKGLHKISVKGLAVIDLNPPKIDDDF